MGEGELTPEAKGDQTERVVLQRFELDTPGDEPKAEGWIVRGTATGTKRAAVKAVVGEEVGIFRAPSARAWKGGVEQAEPDRPAVKALEFDG